MSLDLVSDYSSIDQNIETSKDTLELLFRGQMGLSLSNMNNGQMPDIQAGSWIEVNGDLYFSSSTTAISEIDPYTSSNIVKNNVYVMIGVEDGTCVAFFTNTEPTWSNEKQGWYGSGSYTNYRYIAFMKYERTLFLGKRLIIGNNSQLHGQIFDYDSLWSQVGSIASSGAFLSDLVYGANVYVANAQFDVNKYLAFSIDNGETWSAITTPFVTAYTDFGNGIFFSVGSAIGGGTTATGYRSTNGISWSSITLPESKSWQDIAFGNNTFVAINAVGTYRAITSSDGITWTLRTMASVLTFLKVGYGAGKFVALSNSTSMNYSSDGITWSSGSFPVSMSPRDVHFANGIFVCVGSTGIGGSGYIVTSSDGITWTTRYTSSTYRDLESVTYGNGFWIVTSSAFGPAYLYSKDGISWTVSTYTGISSPNRIAFGSEHFLMCDGLLGTSRFYRSKYGII